MDEMILTDEMAMAMAISEARKGAGYVSPNPQVGCVILDINGRLLSSGYHQKFGGLHAEANALLRLGENFHQKLEGARVFVTLEPCAHQGKTPSCAKALAAMPIKEVIFGLIDPNPRVAGQGAQILTQAGIIATEYQGDLKIELQHLCEHFLVNQLEKRPFLSLKVASSLDGKMALASGESKWITGQKSREYAHYLRATHDAILIGQGTLEFDNPSLDVRHPDFENKANKVFVLLGNDHLKVEINSLNLFKSHKAEDVFFLKRHTNGYLLMQKSQNGTLVQSQKPQFFDKNLCPLDDKLENWPCSILIEGGARVLSSFIGESRAHRLYLFQAPILLGGEASMGWTDWVRIDSMKDKIALKRSQILRFDQDLLITGRFNCL